MKKIVEIHRKKMANLLAAAAEGKLFKKKEKKEAISSISNYNSSESEGEEEGRENIALVPKLQINEKELPLSSKGNEQARVQNNKEITETEMDDSVKRVPKKDKTTSVTLVTTKLARERIVRKEDYYVLFPYRFSS